MRSFVISVIEISIEKCFMKGEKTMALLRKYEDFVNRVDELGLWRYQTFLPAFHPVK